MYYYDDMKNERPQSGENAKRVVLFRGMVVGPSQQSKIRDYIDRHPGASHDELGRGICALFGWKRANGQPPVRGCTTLLARLDRHGVIRLPAAQRRTAGLRRRESGTRAASGAIPESWPERPVDPSLDLVVRPLVAAESARWQAAMQRFHYLGNCRLIGESLRYVALLGDEWVALVGWGAAALHNEPRDRLIGWDRETKARGLDHIVNNSRYLVLPWIRQPNLSSRILSANLRRLSSDWEAAYGHRVYLAETFVDCARFAAVSYRASNWQYLGETKGFGKHGARYTFHGQAKAVFVYPLHRRALELLRTTPPALPQEAYMRTFVLEQLPLDGAEGLLDILSRIPDWRKPRGIRHCLRSILAVAIGATLAGAKSFSAIGEWAADQPKELLIRLGCRRGRPPSERTIRRVLLALDIEQYDAVMGGWIARIRELPGCGLALDGKTLRGSGDGPDGKPVHLLAAVVHNSGEVVAQTRVDRKTNEITRVAPLLDQLDITGTVVTADALLTQREIARYLVEDKHADYVLTVKDNQPSLRQDIEDFFAAEAEEAPRRRRGNPQSASGDPFPPQHQTIDKEHNRIEIRQIWTSDRLNDYLDFPFVGQVARIRRITTDLEGNLVKGRTTMTEEVFLVTSLSTSQANPAQLLSYNRAHWQIENRLHYVRDVAFDEDRCQIRRGNRPHAMASLRNSAISLLRLVGSKNIAASTRELGRKPEAIVKLLGC